MDEEEITFAVSPWDYCITTNNINCERRAEIVFYYFLRLWLCFFDKAVGWVLVGGWFVWVMLRQQSWLPVCITTPATEVATFLRPKSHSS